MRHKHMDARIHRLAGCAALFVFLFAQATSAPSQEDAVQVEVYKGPKIRTLPDLNYPDGAAALGKDGWVELQMMIDPQGRPYEVSVSDSFGGELLENKAIRTAKETRYEPARLGGKAVHAGFAMRVRFAVSNGKGARKEFIASYDAMNVAVNAADRDGADRLLPALNAINLYEEAFRNLALYQYHRRWGTEPQQIADLLAAVAYEPQGHYLGTESFVSASSALIVLLLKQKNYGDALKIWRNIGQFAPKANVDALKPIIEEVEKLRGSSEPIRLAAILGERSSWFNTLFRRNFQVVVRSGQISDIKLRCEKSFVFFRYDPDIRYTVKTAEGECSLELVGVPGTRFELVQT